MDGLDGAFVDRQFFAELVFHIGYDLLEGVLNDFFWLDEFIPEDQLTVAQAVANARIDLVRCAIMERRYCQADFFRDLGITGAGLIIGCFLDAATLGTTLVQSRRSWSPESF